MALYTVQIGLFASIILLIYRFVVIPLFTNPLAKIPRPHWSCLISKTWYQRRCDNKTMLETLRLSHQEHGDIVLLGPNEVSVASIEGRNKIYNLALDKDIWYAQHQQYDTPNLVSMIDCQTHSTQKRLMSAVFAKSYLMRSEDLVTVLETTIQGNLLPLVDRVASLKEPVDVLKLTQWATGDLISGYLFGTDHGTRFLTDRDNREEYFGKDEKDRFWDRMDVGRRLVMDTCEKVRASLDADDRQKTRPVVFQKLYDGLSKIKGSIVDNETMKQIASEMDDHMIAGHEATSVAIVYAVWHLSKDVELQAALRKELRTLQPPVRFGGESLPAVAQLDNLPLLDCVIQETLRLHAPAAGPMPRVVGPGGLTVHDYFIPEGTTVSSNPYTLHRREDIFPSPFEWQPKRWMKGLDGRSSQEVLRGFWAFGSGGRMCIGNHLALIMLQIILAAMYTDFKTSILDDEGIEQSDGYLPVPIGNKLIVQFERAL